MKRKIMKEKINIEPYFQTDLGTLYCGDCLEIMPSFLNESVDLVLTDPPYGTTACKWDLIIPLKQMWAQLKRIIKKNGVIVLTASQPFTSMLGASNIGNLQYGLIWEKSRLTGHLNAKKRPLKSYEDILIFYSRQPTYNPQGLIKCARFVMNSKSDSLRNKDNITSTVFGGIKHQKYYQEFTSYPHQIIKIFSEGKPVHPTQKPVALMEYLIKTYTNEDEMVLDFCIGSGTTAIACEHINRKWIGIELSEEYCEIAKARIKQVIKESQICYNAEVVQSNEKQSNKPKQLTFF